VAGYLERALADRSPGRSMLRRQAYRALSDLRAEFQRTLSEPAAVSRRATTWWPAVVALEQVLDAVTAAAVAADHGGPALPPATVRPLAAVLRDIGTAVRSGGPPSEAGPVDLPPHEGLRRVAEAVRRVQAALA
jgi:hypothetical protein